MLLKTNLHINIQRSTSSLGVPEGRTLEGEKDDVFLISTNGHNGLHRRQILSMAEVDDEVGLLSDEDRKLRVIPLVSGQFMDRCNLEHNNGRLEHGKEVHCWYTDGPTASEMTQVTAGYRLLLNFHAPIIWHNSLSGPVSWTFPKRLELVA